jgi:SAM-dependent methyltransferase
MHHSALNFGKLFFDTYCANLQGATVHDVGAQNVNGSLKDVLPSHLGYVGVDFVAGNGVDIVLEDPYQLPFADESLDVLVCSSCFEHSQFFWLVFLEMLRVLKPQGVLYLNVPSNGSVHRYPVDCWRFYPDSGRALEAWAARNGYAAQLLESFIGERSPDSYESGGAWHDLVAVFVKDNQHAVTYPARMLDALHVYSNSYDSRTGAEGHPEFLSPDHAVLVERERALDAMSQERILNEQRISELKRELSEQIERAEDDRGADEAQWRATQARLEEALHLNRQLLEQIERAEEVRGADEAQRRATQVRLDEALDLNRRLSERIERAEEIRGADEAQRRAMQALLDEILRSRSWRFMAPARKATGIARIVRTSARACIARLGFSASDSQHEIHVTPTAVDDSHGQESLPPEVAAEVRVIQASGMFDEAYYRSEYPDLANIPDPIGHYCQHGWREGRNPSPDFITAYYLETSPDIRDAGMNPFLHYITAGRTEGRPVHPWVARRTEEVVAREVEDIRSSGQFDEAFYRVMNADIQPPPADLIRHYCERGWLEGRDPSDDFVTKDYLALYRDIREAGINPFWHYVVAGANELRKPNAAAMRYEDEISFGQMPSEVKLLAFYTLPEWDSLRRRRSAVKADLQPLLPHSDLGFYDVSDQSVLRAHVALAKRHGVYGFCFALNAMGGGIASTNALAGLLERSDLDIGICVALDTEVVNWDARESGLLRRACTDPRAIRVDGRPVLLVKLGNGPKDAQGQLSGVRKVLRDQGIGPVFLIVCWIEGDSAELIHACANGACDAVLDLPNPLMPRAANGYELLKSGGIHTEPYSVVAAQGAARAEAAGKGGAPIYPSICVGYDNTSTDSSRHVVYTRFQIQHYRRWLDAALHAVRRVSAEDRRFVFLQSWNDWNAGQVLEPDRSAGYSRLNETSRALLGIQSGLLMPKVSVVVPNYNHEAFLRERLDSIYGQTYRNIEVILMDDCSTDGSRRIMDEYAAAHPAITKTLYNETNSGGPFHQWAKGIHAATGDLIWIAESDDCCDARFLEMLVPSFDDEAVLLAYGSCVFVDRAGAPMEHGFESFVSDLECADKWRGSYVETAHREVCMALGIKNTIPNASGTLFRRPEDLLLLDQSWWRSMRVAGDWVFYLHLIAGGKIAFNPAAKNYFRRYQGSAAETTYQKKDFYREVGLACRTVAALYNVPLAVLERCRDGFKAFYEWQVGRSEQEFAEWFDFAAVEKARAARVPNVMVSTMGFYPGGAEIFPIRLANEFRRQGVPVLLLSTGLAAREDGVRRMLRNDVPVVETFDIAPVKSIIEDFGIEVLNTHQWHIQKYPVQLPDVFVGLRSHVATLHGMIEHGNAFAVTEGELRVADRNVTTWVYTADKNLGPFMGFGMVPEHGSRFVKMPNGIQTPNIEPVPRVHMGIPDEAFVLCCVSRAIPDKGWTETIASVQRAREISGRDIRLVLVGNGPVYDHYRQIGVPGFVHLVGFSDNSAGYYASADMGIMLTRFRSESFPLTIVDCLFAGKPYIATSVGDIRNMLTAPEGLAGQVIELEDWQVPVDAAAQAIAAFAVDKQLYATAKALVPQIASRYRIESVASLYVDLFRQAPAKSMVEVEAAVNTTMSCVTA